MKLVADCYVFECKFHGIDPTIYLERPLIPEWEGRVYPCVNVFQAKSFIVQHAKIIWSGRRVKKYKQATLRSL